MEQQEERLFSLAKQLYEAKLWEDYWDNDLIAFQLVDRSEPVFVSVLGKADQDYGFLFYRNLEELSYFFETVKRSQFREFRSLMEVLQTKKCLSLEYDDRTNLSKADYQRIKSSNVTFRGKMAWPVFIDYCPGYCPYPMKEEDTPLMIDLMEKLLATALGFRENLAVYAEKRSAVELFLRTYKKDGSYEDGLLVLPEAIIEGMSLVKEESPVLVTDFEIKRVNTQKFGPSVWELDIDFVGAAINPDTDERPYFPSILIVVDSESSQVICSELIKPEDVEGVQRLLIQLILSENGKPPKIVVDANHHFQIASYLESVLNELGIELIPIQKLPMISVIKEDMLDYFKEE